MDKETIHQQIEILIETLKEQHEGMKENGNHISQIDIDLFLENIRDLYEFSVVLGKMNDRDRKQNQAPEKEAPVETKSEVLTPVILPKEAEIKESFVWVPSHPEFIPKEKPPKEKKINKIGSGVLFEDMAPVIEDIKNKQEPVIPNNEPVSDLKSAIGINEKFLFINELFDGSLEEYNASIDLLNNCQNASEAEQKIFLELQPKYHWDMNNPATKSLMALVERRFIKGS
jgi:hypothetical protein